MIISRTPFRISFFGGGTDYKSWYRENGGSVLVTTIDKYCYISCRYLPPFFEYKTRVAWSQLETVKSHKEIKHPAVAAVLQYLQVENGLEIHHDGDLPARTGLGSSSSFTVGLLHTLYALKRQMPTKEQLAQEAILIERDLMQEKGGIQDQIATTFGGFNRIDFSPNNDFCVHPIRMGQERLAAFQDHLMLCFTGFSRLSSKIAEEQERDIAKNRNQLSRIHEMVDEAVSLLAGKEDLAGFGRLLDESWRVKRTLSERISNSFIDKVYESALDAGALGGKLLGAGGGGFLLLFVKPEDQKRVREKLKGLLHVPFRFDSTGSQIIFYQPNEAARRDYPAEFQLQIQEDERLS